MFRRIVTISGWVLIVISLATNIVVQVITAIQSPMNWTHMELRFLSITIGVIGISLLLACLRDDKVIASKRRR